MEEKTDKQPKKKQQPIYQLPAPNNPECAKVGEIYLSSEVLNAKELLGIIGGALENKEIKEYLKLIEFKKKTGTYFG